MLSNFIRACGVPQSVRSKSYHSCSRAGFAVFILAVVLFPAERPFAMSEEMSSFPIPVRKGLDQASLDGLTERGNRACYQGDELETIGMPCGGIGAGELYVRGDGTLAHWWIFNNARNYGNGPCTCYSTYRPPSLLRQGFLIRAQSSNDQTVVRRLDREAFPNVRFFGEFPIATVEYGTPGNSDFPVAISMEVFSPFIPLNARDSAHPATVLRFKVENTSTRSVAVDIAGWLQNGAGLELAGKFAADSHSRVDRKPARVSTVMRLLESQGGDLPEEKVTVVQDFGNGTYDDWTVEGLAFGDSPAKRSSLGVAMVAQYDGPYLATTMGRPEHSGKLVSRTFPIKDRYLCYWVGGKKGRTVKLSIGGRWLRTNPDKQHDRMRLEYWNVAEHVGQQAHLEILGGNSAPISIGKIYFSNVAPDAAPSLPENFGPAGDMALSVLEGDATAMAAWESWESFRDGFESNGRLEGASEDRRSLGQPQISAVAAGTRLGSGEQKHITFLVTWYFPNLRHGQVVTEGEVSAAGEIVGAMYSNWFDSSLDVADYLSKNLERLYAQTDLFRQTFFDTTLPYWFVHRVGMPLSTLASATCQWWRNGRFWAWEGVACCPGTTPHVWNYAQAVARLFPELERSVREMQDFGPGFDTSTGFVHHSFDGQAGSILKAYREHCMSPDDTFLQAIWPKARAALEYLIEKDGNDDGIIEGTQPQTYDGSFRGPNTYVGSLYLAALRAGEEMAVLTGDQEFAQKARRIFQRGRRNTLNRLWDGEYFIHEVDRDNLPPGNHYADGCLSDQVFGQSWAHQVDLGYVYPETNVVSALQSIWNYNWAPDVGRYNSIYPPWRWYAHPGEPGLLLCTWPKSSHLGDRAVGYCNEVWTGIEYQVASHMFYEAMVTEGLAIVHGIHSRYDGKRHNPWNEVECGDHYARAMASWGCLLGISGYLYDGPAGRIGFSPRVTPDDFRCFFSAAEGWGTIAQIRGDGFQANTIAVRWGRLRVSSFVFEIPEAADLLEASVLISGQRVEAKAERKNRRVTVRLEEESLIESGETAEVRMTF